MFSDDLIRTIGDDDDVPEESDSASDNEAVSFFYTSLSCTDFIYTTTVFFADVSGFYVFTQLHYVLCIYVL